MKIELNGKIGAAAAIVVALGAGAWGLSCRSELYAQGREAARKHIEVELYGEAHAAFKRGEITLEETTRASDFTITDFHSRRFIPKSPAEVRVNVATDRGPKTFYLRMTRLIGSWRVDRSIPAPVIPW